MPFPAPAWNRAGEDRAWRLLTVQRGSKSKSGLVGQRGLLRDSGGGSKPRALRSSRHRRPRQPPGAASWSRFMSWLMAFGAAHPGYVLYSTSDDAAFIYSAHREQGEEDLTWNPAHREVKVRRTVNAAPDPEWVAALVAQLNGGGRTGCVTRNFQPCCRPRRPRRKTCRADARRPRSPELHRRHLHAQRLSVQSDASAIRHLRCVPWVPAAVVIEITGPMLAFFRSV